MGNIFTVDEPSNKPINKPSNKLLSDYIVNEQFDKPLDHNDFSGLNKLCVSKDLERLFERWDIYKDISKLNIDILDIGDKGCSSKNLAELNESEHSITYHVKINQSNICTSSYLDFFQPSDLKHGSKIMKGIDLIGREFYIFKSTFEFEDGSEHENFTSFSQSYTIAPLRWHSCDQNKRHIMNTGDCATNEQFKFILDLFTNKSVQLDKKKCIDLKLNFGQDKPGFFSDFFSDTHIKYPIKVKI